MLIAIVPFSLATASVTGPDEVLAAIPVTISTDLRSADISVGDSLFGPVLKDRYEQGLYVREGGDVTTSDLRPYIAASEATVSSDVDASMVAVAVRPDGTRQLAYAGHPLYALPSPEPAPDPSASLVVFRTYRVSLDWDPISPDGTPIAR